MRIRARSNRLLIGAVLFLAACEPGEKVAGGTGTHTGNTVTAQALYGRILTLDGAPSIRTRVVLRPLAYVPEGVASAGTGLDAAYEWETVTDSLGGFSLSADTGTAYLLECARETGSGTQVAWLEGIRLDSAGISRGLGDIKMTQASDLAGGLKKDSGIPMGGQEFWVGFSGTEHFSRLDIDGRFNLKGIAPGTRTLEIRRRMPGFRSERFAITGWRLFPGTRAVMEPLALPPMVSAAEPGTGDSLIALSAAACLEDVSSLVEHAYAGPTIGGETRVLRTMMLSKPPQWIKLDPCLGVWRSLMVLPMEATTVSNAFSSPDADYLILENGRILFKIARDGGQSSYAQVAQQLSGAEYYAGRFYAMGQAGSKLKIYADFDSLWKNLPQDSVELGIPVAQLNDIAIDSGFAYFGLRADTTRIQDFNLDVGRDSKSMLTGSGSHLEGMVSAPDGGLYLLNGLKQLDVFDPRSGVRARRYQVETPYALRSLTRYLPPGSRAEIDNPKIRTPADRPIATPLNPGPSVP